MSENLKPCPKCGAEAKVLTVHRTNRAENVSYTTYNVACVNVDCCVASGDHGTRDFWDAERMAIYTWNHQPRVDGLRERVKELEMRIESLRRNLLALAVPIGDGDFAVRISKEFYADLTGTENETQHG